MSAEQVVQADGLAETGWLLRVTDLKQFAYCPRVVYYSYCLPLLRPMTFKMKAGIEAHEAASVAEQRRSLRAYGLEAGERRFDVALTSQRLGLSGQVDMVILTVDGSAVPVDYKLSKRKPAPHFRLQLAAYAELIEEQWQRPVERGFLYLLPLRRAEVVPITRRLRNRLLVRLDEMREMIETQRMPEPTKQLARCIDCEFRRFCNDVL